MNNNCLSILSQSAAMVALCGAASGAFAHNSITPSSVTEGASSYHNMVIGHGCHDETGAASIAITAESTVFPDPTMSTFTFFDASNNAALPDKGQNYTAYFDFVTHSGTGGGMQAIQSNDVFDKKTVLEKTSPVVAGKFNTVGYSYTGGKLPGNINGMIPFKLDKVAIKATSCVTSVTFKIAVADICKKTPVNKFSEEALNLWTPNYGEGSKFSGFFTTVKDPVTNQDKVVWQAENSPVSLKVTRDTVNNPYQDDCTTASNRFSVVVTPSEDQLERDLPIPKFWGER